MSNQVIPTEQFVNVFNANIDGISQLAVNARELHSFLNVGKVFGAWINERIEKYGFVENQDFILTISKIGKRSNVVQKDYHLTLNTAKELAMVENNEQGRKVRRYFIECEKALLAPTTLTSDQAFQLKKAVEQKCKHNNVHYQTVWNAIKNRFGKASYREIESTDFHEALAIIESIELPQAIEHQALNIGDYLNPKVNEIMDYVHGLEHIVFHSTGKYPQRPFNKDEIAKGIIGYCLRNQSIELSFSERGLGFNLVDRTMLRIHDSNIAEHIKNGNVKKQYLDDIIQASVARLV